MSLSMGEMPDVITVHTNEGDIDVHYASPEMTVFVNGSFVDAYEYGDMLEGGDEVRQGWVDAYHEDGPQVAEFGIATFYRVIREYTNRRRNTDKRLGLIGG